MRLTLRGIYAMLVVAVVIDVAYWTTWFVDRSLLASDTTQAYYDFENAFPAADAWLGLCCVLAIEALARRRATALLWLLAAGSAGLYLLGMDVLYDLEHGIYVKGGGGVVEACVNVVTLVFSVTALRWAWTRREALLTGTVGLSAETSPS